MNWLRQFMWGRYGADQLSVAMLVVYFALTLIMRISGLWALTYVCWALMALCLFRMLSRNTSRRFEENQKFLKAWHPFRDAVRRAFARAKNSRTHRYFRCPDCKKQLKVPRGRGKIHIVCPHCSHQFTKKT